MFPCWCNKFLKKNGLLRRNYAATGHFGVLEASRRGCEVQRLLHQTKHTIASTNTPHTMDRTPAIKQPMAEVWSSW